MSRTLVVTNDFPPRAGGIQAFVHGLALGQAAGSIVVYAPAWERAAEFDAAAPFPVVRHPGSLMLPVRDVAKRARDIARAHGCDSVWFGAAAPLGLLAPYLRRHSDIRIAVASTHGHEVGWATVPGARQMLARIARGVDVMTYLGGYTRARLEPVVGRSTRLEQLTGGVDIDAFHPSVDGRAVRARLGLGDRPVVVCVSRLMPRKGQDILIRALPGIRARVPDAALLIVGGGPGLPRLQRLAVDNAVADEVRFTGSVPWAELPAHYAAGDVFAMPCRTRRRGLDVEGLGIVYLEASASGLPVVAGRSGGAPDAVLEGTTGTLVDGRSVAEVESAISELLANPARAQVLGVNGREWVEREWRWEVQSARLAQLLSVG